MILKDNISLANTQITLQLYIHICY